MRYSHKCDNSMADLAGSLRFWLGFTDTPGLSWFGKSERYSVWCNTHKRLMESDGDYALASDRFHIQVVAVWVFALMMFFSATATAPLVQAWCFAAIGAASLGWFVIRAEQRRRNSAIGHVLCRQLPPRN